MSLSLYLDKASASEVTDTAEKDIEVPKVIIFLSKLIDYNRQMRK